MAYVGDSVVGDSVVGDSVVGDMVVGSAVLKLALKVSSESALQACPQRACVRARERLRTGGCSRVPVLHVIVSTVTRAANW
jgi:hypothetical protein